MINPERGETILEVGGKNVLFTANFYAIMKIERAYREQGRPQNIQDIVREFLLTSVNSIPPITDLVTILYGMCTDSNVTMEDIYKYLIDLPEGMNEQEGYTQKLTPLVPVMMTFLDPTGNKLRFKEDPKEKLKPKVSARKNSKRALTSENS